MKNRDSWRPGKSGLNFMSPLVFFISMVLMFALSYKSKGEGSAQFKPDTTKTTFLMILNTQPTYGTFAGYSASDTNRLFIRINNPATERIYFGMGQRNSTATWYFRVKDPNGNIVFGPTLLPTSGTGFINYHSQAIAGPNTFTPQGYTPFVITPTPGVSGAYYIEFNQGSGTAVSNNKEIGLGIFDITVGVPSTNTMIPGRLFSYNWSFNTDSYANQFFGSFFIYGADSSVTKVDLNGIKPYKFRVSCNSFGALNTGNATANRRSQLGFQVPPELKLFLRDPDQVAFPNGNTQFLNGAVTLVGCTRDSLCIQVNLTKRSDVVILIDRNGNNVYNPGTADRLLTFPGVDPGPSCLPWDGKDGFGNYVPVGGSVQIQISVQSGEVNLPIFDVESHPTGYSMSIVRPVGGAFVDSLYYDDVLVGGTTNLAGCPFPCHTWVSTPPNTDQNSIGNNNTINTYWFARLQSVLANLVMPDFLITNAGPDQSVCLSLTQQDTIQLSGTIAFSTSAYSGSKQWVSSGTGSFVPNDSTYNAKYVPSTADINAGSVWLILGPRYVCDYPVDSVRIFLRKRPALNATPSTVSCFGGSSGSVSLAVSNGVGPYTYNWSNGASSQNLNSIPSGTYTVTVTGSNSCSSTVSAIVTQPAAALAGSINGISNVSCFGQSNGSVNFNASGGTAPYTYLWSNGSTNAGLSGVPAGTYSVTVTDARGCTSVTNSITISAPSAPLSIAANSITNVSCFNNSTGAITLNVNGGTSPYSFLWSNGSTSQNISGLTSGTYTVTATDANGCSSMQSITVSQPAAALTGNTIIAQQVSCFGGNNGAVNLSVAGGTSPYTFNWSNGATSQNISGLSSGTYTVTITDFNGCTAQRSAIISQPVAALTPSLNSSTNVNCFGGNNGAIDLSVTGGTSPYTYVWSNGASTQDVSGLAAGSYTVTITDANGCTAIQNVAITQPASALGGNTTVSQNVNCFGGNNGEINLSVNGGTTPYVYSWNNGATSQNVSGLVSGTYTVTITDAMGCTLIRNATITQPSAALSSAINVGQHVSCFSGNNGQILLTVAGGTSPYNYVWSNGASTQNISNLTAGTYSVTITDANGCTSQKSASVTQPGQALSGSTTVTSNISCFSGNNGAIDLTVAGGTAPFTFTWSTGATSEDLNGLAAGSYTVTITDANGCSAQSSGTIMQPAGALSTNINISQNIPCYGGGSGAIDLSVSGGTIPYTYLWNTGATTQDISNLAAGVYTVTITDDNGCNTTASGTITQPSAPLASLISGNQAVLCNGGNNGSLSLSVSGGTFPYTFQWSNGQTTKDIINLTAGTYTVTITDANGCTTIQNGTVTQPASALSANAVVVQQVLCFGGSNASVDLTVNGGTVPYTYSWSNGQTTQDLSSLAAGTYTVTISDANGCITSQSVTVTQPSAALNATASSTQQVSCFGGNNGTATASITGGTSPYTYSWSNGATTQNISGLAAGTYTITVTDANGCTFVSSTNITQPSAALSGNTSISQQVSCFGGSNGSIALSVAGGTSPYSYLWSNGSTSQNQNGLSSGVYTVTVTDGNGCTIVRTGTINQPVAALNGTLNVSQNVLCFGGNNGNINLSVSGGTTPYSYSWSTGATTQNISGLQSGAYTVTVTDANGCTTTHNTTVTQPSAAISATANVSQNVSCFGGNNGAISLTVNGGTSPYVFNWNNGSTTQNIAGLTAGLYTVTITDANGCTFVQTANVGQPAAPLSNSVTVSQNVFCFAGNNGEIDVNVNGGTSPYSYLWSNGSTIQNQTGLTAGTYSVTITDANGCTTSGSATISQPAAALNGSASASQNVNCFGGGNGSVVLSINGGTTPYSYNWSNGSIQQNLTGLTAGTYSVTVIDANGCVLTASATVTQPVAALASSVNVGQNINCFGGNNGSAGAMVSGGTTPYAFAWSNGSTTQNLTGLPAGIYTVSITDANGCTSSSSASIIQPDEALTSSGTIDQDVSCYGGSNGAASVNVSGGTSPYSYLWNNGETTDNIVGLSSGSYTVTVTDANGCTTMQTVSVGQPSAALSISAVPQQQVSCFGGSNGSINVTVNGGTAPYTYVWSNGLNTEDIYNLNAGTYTVDVVDLNGCTDQQTITITQPSAPVSPSISAASNVSCFGGANGSIDLSVTGGTAPYTYQWNNGSVTQDLTGLISGTYTVIVTDANGCTALQTATVTQPAAAMSGNASASQNVSCFGGSNGSIALSVSGGTAPYSFIWSNGSILQNLSGLSSGTYTVTITDAQGCTINQFATVSQPLAELSGNAAPSQQVSCFGGNNGSITLSVSGGTAPYSFNWNTGASSQNVSGLSSGIYTVTVTDANGCTVIRSATITQPSAALNPSVTASGNVNCFGGNNGSIDISVSGGTTPYSYLWNNGAITQDITGLSSGTYTVTITDANGCTAVQTASITQPVAALNGTASVTQNVNCFGGTNGSMTLNVNGGTSPYSFVWSNGATTQNISNLTSGTYTVTVTDALGCTTQQSAFINQPAAALNTVISSGQQVSCFGGNNGQVLLSVSGGTSPYTFNWSNGQSTQNISNLAAGTYTVTVTDFQGCTSEKSITVTQPVQALSGSTTVTSNISCFSGNNGAIDLTVAGGTGPYTFSWSTGATTEDLSGLAAGSYTVTITDANGCTAQSSGTIVQPAGALSTNINISQNIPCFGGGSGAIDLSVSGGTTPYSYIWNTGATTQDISNLIAGVYTVTITDVNGCNTMASATITQPSAALSATVNSTQPVWCFGGNDGSVGVSVAGGTFPYSYMWSNGETSSSILNLVAGTYTVTVTDANGCTTLQSATITQPSAALSSSAAVTAHVLCNSGNNGSIDISVSGGTAPYTYSWSNGQSSQNIAGLTSGTYTVTVTDANGCISIQSATVTQPSAALSAGAGTTQAVFCFGGNTGTATVTTAGGTVPYSYVWSNGSNSQNISNLWAGTYTVTVTDANGCSAMSNTIVSQPAAALSGSTAVGQHVLCYSGNNGTIDITISGGTVPYSYIWSNGSTTQNVNNLTSGTYVVTVTDINGCSITMSETITQPSAALNSSATVTANVQCNSGNNGAIDLTVTGGTSPYNYLWSNGQTTEDISGLNAGTYTVTVTDANGCSTVQDATVTQPAGALSAGASSIQSVSCFGGNTGSATVNATGGTVPYTYVWSNGVTNQNISNLISGVYTVTVTDANGCTSGSAVNITQPVAALSASTVVGQNVSCFGGNNGSINLIVNGGTAPYSYNWNNGTTTQNINGLVSGAYTVTITDVNGCTIVVNETVSQPTAVLNAAATVTANVLCYSGNNAGISLNISGGTVPYNYAWSNGSSSQNVTNLVAGWYYVVVTDSNGCVSSDSAEVTQPSAALASAINSSQNVSCFGGNNGSIDLTVTGGTSPYSYLWNNGSTNEDLTALPAGTYSVTITDANGCLNTNSLFISQPSAALALAVNSTTGVLCFGGTNGAIDITATGGTVPYQFMWSNGETTEDIFNLASGVYTVVITDANGCIDSASATISQPAAAISQSLSVTQQVNCFAGETGAIDLTVSGGTMPYTFIWSNGATTEDISMLFAGTYTVTITDANGCTSAGQIDILQPAAPLLSTITVVSNVFCNGGSTGSLDLTANGGTAPYTYLWSNGSTTQDISNLATGVYTVTVTDANGCTTVNSAGIGQPSQQLSATANIQHVLCFNGNNGLIDISPSGGTQPYSFIWNTGATTEDIGILIAGVYTVTITDANSCDTTMTFTVTQPQAPLIPVLTIGQHVSCFDGSDGSMNLSVSGGTPPYTYLWSNGTTTQSNSNLTAGQYTVTITDGNGCNAIISDVVTQPAAPLTSPVTVNQQVSCFGGSNGVVTANATGGTSPYTYLWSTGSATPSISNLAIGTYTVTVTDSKGCTYIASVQVTQPAAPLSVSGTTTIANCIMGLGGTITINATGGTAPYSFMWSNGSTVQNQVNAAPGSYSVTVTDANGCVTNGIYIVGNDSEFHVNAGGPTTICVGETVLLIADSIPGGSYQWYFQGNPLNGATGMTFETPAAGFYSVSVTVPCGTFYTDSIEVIVKSVENASITSNQIICPPEMVRLHATGGVIYAWTPASFISNTQSPDPIVAPPVFTTYTVEITNEWGCKTTLSVDIAVACDTLLVPTGFSPNGDGVNDGYVIDHIDNYPGNKLWVYNRWGNLVYKAKDYDNSWDGTANISGVYMGKKLPTGTYFYILDLNDNSKPRSGYLIIRR